MKSALLFLSAFLVLTLSCGGGDDESAKLSDFSAVSMDVMPVVESVVGGLIRPSANSLDLLEGCAADWACGAEQGNMAYQLYRMLADPKDDPALEFPEETPAWGVENLYHNLEILSLVSESLTVEEAGEGTSEVEGETFTATYPARQEFSPPQIIDPAAFKPFSALDDVAYRYYRSASISSRGSDGGEIHLAWKIEDRVSDLLMGNSFSDAGDTQERGIYQGRFSAASGDLILDIAMWTSQGFLPRWVIRGNQTENTFQAKYLKRNVIEGYYNLSLVGLGKSEGAGEFFLVKVKEWETGSERLPSISYFCISAEATKADFGEAYGDGANSTFNDVSDSGATLLKRLQERPSAGWCDAEEDYVSQILDMSFLDVSDLPEAESGFNSEFLAPYE